MKKNSTAEFAMVVLTFQAPQILQLLFLFFHPVMKRTNILFFLTFGQKTSGTLPVLMEGMSSVDDYINPLPHALMLTAIVVSLGTTGVGLALLMKIKDLYGTIEDDEISRKGGKH